jgi:hypothetical protein
VAHIIATGFQIGICLGVCPLFRKRVMAEFTSAWNVGFEMDPNRLG